MSTSKTKILQRAFMFLTTDRSFQKRWVSISSIEAALRLRYSFGDHYNFDKAMLSKSLGKLHPQIDSLQDQNDHGVYRCKMSQGYFFTIQNATLSPPEMLTTHANNSKWIELCKVDQQLLASYGKKVNSYENREQNYGRHAKKKQKVLDDIDIFLANEKSRHNTTICMNRNPPQMEEEWIKCDYWDSGEAILLFNPPPGKSVKQCLCDRDKLLQDVIEDADKVETIIEDWLTGNSAKLLTTKQERRIVTQCLYLRKAYEIAVQRMNAWTWKECCVEAIKLLRDCGISYVRHERTIQRWHMFFRQNETLPNPQGHSKKLLEPKVFDFFPELKLKIHDFCGNPDNQPSMSSESVAAEIRQNILPKCYDDLLSEIDDPAGLPSYEELLQMLDLKRVCPNTAWRWLQLMGYKYDENRRCYYTDGHEREDVVEDRNKRFLVQYFKLERRAHRWVQLTEEKAIELEESLTKPPLQKNVAYNYATPEGVSMREYHLDTHKVFYDYVTANNKQYGGDLSVRLRVGERPVMLVGQDESTFHQFVFSKKQWKGPNGKAFLMPKSEGEIYMASGFTAREFGLGLGSRLTPEVRNEINASHRQNKDYVSTADAELVKTRRNKTDFNGSYDPCLAFFRTGVQHEGYWNSSHAKLQLEDVVDALTTIFPQFDLVFLFDQSSGHTKMRIDSLHMRNMNVSHGGSVGKMHDTIILEVGPHPRILNVNDKQVMYFVDEDDGPFWTTPAQRVATKHDRQLGTAKSRAKTKIELLKDLRQSGYDTTKQRYLKEDLLALCGQRNLPTTVEEQGVKEGWLGKPKGMLQILWERGWIDSSKVVSARSMRYSKDGKKEDFGEDGKLKEASQQYALSYLLSHCTDFKEEKSDLEHLATELSGREATISILFTPKYHCELAGEGIEYCWGAAKRIYRKLPLKDRRSWESFRNSVVACLSQVNITMCRRFSGKARGYMLGYRHQALEAEEGREEVKSFERNEKIQKIYRSHRDALTFDGDFISKVMRECIDVG
jgi:hypothetical protein